MHNERAKMPLVGRGRLADAQGTMHPAVTSSLRGDIRWIDLCGGGGGTAVVTITAATCLHFVSVNKSKQKFLYNITFSTSVLCDNCVQCCT